MLTEILRGGQDKVHEAGAVVVGGHTIIDEELKFGLSRHRSRRIRSASSATRRAMVGDRLVLTKPLGTGLLATAGKRGDLGTDEAAALYASMCKLNATASRAALAVGARCATDVTGFGLLGHASHIAEASGVTLDDRSATRSGAARRARSLGARDSHRRRRAQRGVSRVARRLGRRVRGDRALLIDPQTSGGLLVAVPAGPVAEYLSLVPEGVEIGEVIPRQRYGLVLA